MSMWHPTSSIQHTLYTLFHVFHLPDSVVSEGTVFLQQSLHLLPSLILNLRVQGQLKNSVHHNQWGSVHPSEQEEKTLANEKIIRHF